MSSSTHARDSTNEAAGVHLVFACKAILAIETPDDLIGIGVAPDCAATITQVARLTIARRYEIGGLSSHIAVAPPVLELAREMPDDDHRAALDTLIDISARLIATPRQRWYSFLWTTRVLPRFDSTTANELPGISGRAVEALKTAIAAHRVRQRAVNVLLDRTDLEELAEGVTDEADADLIAAMVGRRSLLQFVRRADKILDASERLAFEKWASDRAQEQVRLNDI